MPSAKGKKPKEPKPPPGPNDLRRESAGAYRSGDGRFEVQKSDLGWFLVDTEQANEFGQQLIHGPMSTLKAVREAMPGARDIKPLLRVKPRRGKPAPVRGGSNGARAPSAPAAQPSWIERLPDAEAREVRALIRALEKAGIPDAEDLVKRHRGDEAPSIAMRLIEQRLRALVDDWPEAERERARELVAVLADDGMTVAGPLPRWAVVELGPDEQVPKRRIRPRI